MRIIKQIESLIISYKEKVEKDLHSESQKILLIFGVDETWLEHMLLVCQELSSGYIFFEEPSKTRTTDKWASLIDKFVSLYGSFKFFVSDRAKALIKLAKENYLVNSVSDLFHMLQDINKGICLALSSKIKGVKKQLKKLNADTSGEQISILEKKLQLLKDYWHKYKQGIAHINKTLHPFKEINSKQNSTDAGAEIKADIKTIKTIINDNEIEDNGHIDKAERQVDDAVSVIDIWWTWVNTQLAGMGLSNQIITWIITVLLPYIYWKIQIRKSHGNSELKSYYKTIYDKAKVLFDSHPTTLIFTNNKLKEWILWAEDMADKFQRSSSQVEGRNGLSQINHSIRGVNNDRIKALTVIHNFNTIRDDGTTPAERLFKKKCPSLFEYILEGVKPLPLPKNRNKTIKISA